MFKSKALFTQSWYKQLDFVQTLSSMAGQGAVIGGLVDTLKKVSFVLEPLFIK